MSDNDHDDDRDGDDDAARVGAGVDALLEGRDPGATDPAIVAARLIRASLQPPTLAPERRTALAVMVAGQWTWRRRRRRFTTVLAAAAAIALVVFAALLLGREEGLPSHLRSRETATLIPGPFPAEQTARDRIDLIYADRLGSFRALELSSAAARRPSEARPAHRAASTIAGVSP